MDITEQIVTVIDELNEVSIKLWQCNEESYKEFEKKCADWMRIINQVLTDLSIWKQQNNDIALDVIFQQIKNLENALQYKDDFMLADTLKYEISNTLNYYLEIVNEYGKK